MVAQADGRFRTTTADIARLKTRNASGAMVPIGSVASFRNATGPYRVPRYDLFPAAEVQGGVAPGYSSGYGLSAMEALARQTLPAGIGFEWTDLAFQQRQAGTSTILIFGASVLFVFMVLAAQYESWSLPLSVVLIVPMCLLAAVSGLLLRGMSVDILGQIGFVVLVDLASKNAILIVEFAKQAQDSGATAVEAAVQAARTRLRPILMTSLAFILGVVPLVTATGAGAELRQSLGTAVFFGILGVTGFGLVFTPVFYAVVQRLFHRRHSTPTQQDSVYLLFQRCRQGRRGRWNAIRRRIARLLSTISRPNAITEPKVHMTARPKNPRSTLAIALLLSANRNSVTMARQVAAAAAVAVTTATSRMRDRRRSRSS